MTAEEKKEYHRQYYLKNKEKLDARVRKFLADNPEKRKEYHKKQVQKNGEKMKAYRKKYYQENKEKIITKIKVHKRKQKLF